MTEWQPIETAPKGETVVAFDPKHGILFAEYNHNSWLSVCAGGSEYCESSLIEPSYWMPLPAAPQGKIPEPECFGTVVFPKEKVKLKEIDD